MADDARAPASGEVEPPDFDALYAGDPDPWEVATSWYERRKLGVLLASLPREHYATAWEPGCGIGVATAALAERAGRLLATDGSQRAVQQTLERTRGLPGVAVTRSALPERPVAEPVELVVAAEFLFYLPDLTAALETLWDALAPGGHLVTVHWKSHPHDAFRSGADTQRAVGRLAQERGGAHLVHHEEEFVLDVHQAPHD